MPLQLSDDEMSVLMSLAGPIDQQRRPQFLQEVAQELEASGPAGASESVRCTGWRARFRGAFSTRRNCPTRARWRAPKGRSPKLEHYGMSQKCARVFATRPRGASLRVSNAPIYRVDP
jgi:hypothetical protein